MDNLEKKADIGLAGLAVMGQNLVLNMNDHGYTVAVYNRTKAKTDAFLSGPAAGREDIIGTDSVEALTAVLNTPKKIMLMVKAGPVVDQFIDQLLPFLQPGDIIIDGGNSNYADTNRRYRELGEQGIRFIGMGVSGGEEGARRGPSLMPGGDSEAWPVIRPIFQDIAAKTAAGEVCCDWVGEAGAGHYVKMVHNGIEYGDIQLICEAYHLMKEGLGFDYPRMAGVFRDWNRSELESYLIEITADILEKKDEDGSALVEKILDTAGQKGTGKWTAIGALELGIPLTLISDAVHARFMSARYHERQKAAGLLEGPVKAEVIVSDSRFSGETFLEDLQQALLGAKIISYTQGYMLMAEAAKEFGWNLAYGNIALMWREGCIIRSAFLGEIKTAFDRDPELDNLLFDKYFQGVMNRCQQPLRRVVAAAAEAGIPLPSFSGALSFYDSFRNPRLPANLLQAQRDYFGAHTYERLDRPRGEFYHADWTGTGPERKSDTYNA